MDTSSVSGRMRPSGYERIASANTLHNQAAWRDPPALSKQTSTKGWPLTTPQHSDADKAVPQEAFFIEGYEFL